MSERSLLSECLKQVVIYQYGAKDQTGSNYVTSPQSPSSQKRSTSLLSKACEDFTRIIANVIEQVYIILQSRETNESPRNYFQSLEAYYCALQAYGLPVPDHFSEKFVLQALKALPRQLFIHYCNSNMFYMNHSILLKIAAQNIGDYSILSYLARYLHYKKIHFPENVEELHLELREEYALHFQFAKIQAKLDSGQSLQSQQSTVVSPTPSL